MNSLDSETGSKSIAVIDEIRIGQIGIAHTHATKVVASGANPDFLPNTT